MSPELSTKIAKVAEFFTKTVGGLGSHIVTVWATDDEVTEALPDAKIISWRDILNDASILEVHAPIVLSDIEGLLNRRREDHPAKCNDLLMRIFDRGGYSAQTKALIFAPISNRIHRIDSFFMNRAIHLSEPA